MDVDVDFVVVVKCRCFRCCCRFFDDVDGVVDFDVDDDDVVEASAR